MELMEDVMSDKYVDAYVMPVPKSKVDAYKAFSKKIGTFVKKHGALELERIVKCKSFHQNCTICTLHGLISMKL